MKKKKIDVTKTAAFMLKITCNNIPFLFGKLTNVQNDPLMKDNQQKHKYVKSDHYYSIFKFGENC